MYRDLAQEVRIRPTAGLFSKLGWLGILRRSAAPVCASNGFLSRVVAGGLLLAASLLKGYQFLVVGTSTSTSSASFWFSLIEIPIECGMGLWLLTGIAVASARILSVMLFISFAGYSMRAALQGRPSCGCFGEVTLSPWVIVGVDVVTIALLSWWNPTASSPGVTHVGVVEPGQTQPIGPWPAQLLRTFVPCLALGFPAGWLALGLREGVLDAPEGIFVVEADQWLNREFPLLPYIDIGRELKEGDWIVLLYHFDCPTCQEAVKWYEQETVTLGPSLDRVAMIEIPPWDPRTAPPRGACRRGQLDTSHDWFVKAPLHVRLSAGKVVEISREVFGERPRGDP